LSIVIPLDIGWPDGFILVDALNEGAASLKWDYFPKNRIAPVD
jgi:hypothetical protein